MVVGDNVDIGDALQLAQQKNLDLVEIAPKAEPPVCKIMDFGKFKYEKERGERLQHAKQKKTNEIKGIRISFREGEHDLAFKRKSAIKFLNSGNKVKIDMTVKGREKAHFGLANEKLNNFVQAINEETAIAIEGRIQRGPRGLTVIIQPSKK